MKHLPPTTLLLSLLPLLLLLLAAGCGSPDPARKVNALMPRGTGFIDRVLETEDGPRRYRVFIPHNYSPQHNYPTIIFLHGHGETGRDGVAPTTVGIGPHIADRYSTFDFITIFPQHTGNWKGRAPAQLVIDTLDDVKRDYAIDDDRIALTGLSTGGEGTWLIGARHRERFAALVPACAYAAHEAVPDLLDIPIWAFHNARDLVVPVRGTRDMVRAIEAGGGNILYTEFDTWSHNCWDQVYKEPDLYTWLRQQRRRPHRAASRSEPFRVRRGRRSNVRSVVRVARSAHLRSGRCRGGFC